MDGRHLGVPLAEQVLLSQTSRGAAEAGGLQQAAFDAVRQAVKQVQGLRHVGPPDAAAVSGRLCAHRKDTQGLCVRLAKNTNLPFSQKRLLRVSSTHSFDGQVDAFFLHAPEQAEQMNCRCCECDSRQ